MRRGRSKSKSSRRAGSFRPQASAEPGKAAGIDDPFLALMSQLLDSAFSIPGTKIRFGFDPLIGLIPGVGDTAAALTSLLLIWKALGTGCRASCSRRWRRMS